jgi:DNA-binding MarR family transcriptional regulator
MPFIMLKDVPRYECLLEYAQQFPDLDPSAAEAYLNLLRTSDEVFRAREAYLAQHHLSQGRFTVMMQLLDKSKNVATPRTPAELADLSGVRRATMTGLVDTLERDGLVEREPDPVDRRMMLVRLTARGEQVLRDVLPGHFQWMATLMSPLDEAERKTLVRLLSKIVERVPPPSATADGDR